jgi:hypothetical protein
MRKPTIIAAIHEERLRRNSMDEFRRRARRLGLDEYKLLGLEPEPVGLEDEDISELRYPNST